MSEETVVCPRCDGRGTVRVLGAYHGFTPGQRVSLRGAGGAIYHDRCIADEPTHAGSYVPITTVARWQKGDQRALLCWKPDDIIPGRITAPVTKEAD